MAWQIFEPTMFRCSTVIAIDQNRDESSIPAKRRINTRSPKLSGGSASQMVKILAPSSWNSCAAAAQVSLRQARGNTRYFATSNSHQGNPAPGGCSAGVPVDAKGRAINVLLFAENTRRRSGSPPAASSAPQLETNGSFIFVFRRQQDGIDDVDDS